MARFWNRWIGRRTPSHRKELKKRTSLRRRPRVESLENRQLLAANIFHNEALPEDVNEDGQITALDALTVINEMNREQRGLEVDDGQTDRRSRMTDVNNDGRRTALDALMVINRLNRDRGDLGNRDPGIDNPVEQPSDETEDQNTDDLVDNDDGVTTESSDVVLEWNELFGEVLADAESFQQNPGYASRSQAILNLAIYDAVGIATEGADAATFYDYPIDLTGDVELSAEIAASEAAYTVLSALYPQQQATLDAFAPGAFRVPLRIASPRPA